MLSAQEQNKSHPINELPTYWFALLLLGFFINYFNIGEPFQIIHDFSWHTKHSIVVYSAFSGLVILFCVKVLALLQGKDITKGAHYTFVAIFLAASMWSYIALYQVNTRFDKTSGEVQYFVIHSKDRGSYRSTNWQRMIWIKDPANLSDAFAIHVSDDFYFRAKQGSKLKAITHRGHLGFEFIAAYELEPK